MKESLFAGSRKWSVSFVTDRAFRMINTDNTNTNRISPTVFELNDLIAKIVDYPVDLLDHRFGQYFYLYSDFHCGDGAPAHQIVTVANRIFAGDDLAKSPISTARRHAAPPILNI